MDTDDVTERLLSFTAPYNEATFYSLPFIEELLFFSRASHAARAPGLAASLASSNYSRLPTDPSQEVDGATTAAPVPCGDTFAIVRDALEQERELLEHFAVPETCAPAPPPGATGSPKAAAEGPHCALLPLTSPEGRAAAAAAGMSAAPLPPRWILQTGLARAAGLHAPPRRPADEIVLGRWRVGAAHYAETSGSDLRQSAVLEWLEDVLTFIDRQGFSVVQARCVLLDALGLLVCLSEVPDDATEQDVEVSVSAMLCDALRTQTCAVPSTVVERQVRHEEVTREVPDPALVASLERRLREEKLNKKQQQALRAQLEQAPLVSLVTLEEKAEEVRQQLDVGPYFTLSEAAVVLDFLCSSVLLHWRLWVALLTTEQPQTATSRTATVVRAVPLVVPPLAAFLPEDVHNAQVGRTALWREAEAALESDYEGYVVGLARLQEAQAADSARLKAERDAAQAANRQNVLSSEDFGRVERAFLLRLQRSLALNETVGRRPGEAPAEEATEGEAEKGAAAPAPRVPTPPPPTDKKPAGKKGAAGGGGKVPPPVTELPPPESIKIRPDAVFVLEEVENRVSTVKQVMEEQQEARLNKKGKH